MSALSEVSVLIAQRAADLEKAREIFTSETRSFVSGILAGVRRLRNEPWTTPRVRLDIHREIETEAKAGGYLTSQFASGRVDLRFKRGTNFTVIADIRLGIEFDETAGGFYWQVTLVPAARYARVDDALWSAWRSRAGVDVPPGAMHYDKLNMVRFVARPISSDLGAELAFNDIKNVLEFVISADAALADAVGFEFAAADEGL